MVMLERMVIGSAIMMLWVENIGEVHNLGNVNAAPELRLPIRSRHSITRKLT